MSQLRITGWLWVVLGGIGALLSLGYVVSRALVFEYGPLVDSCPGIWILIGLAIVGFWLRRGHTLARVLVLAGTMLLAPPILFVAAYAASMEHTSRGHDHFVAPVGLALIVLLAYSSLVAVFSGHRNLRTQQRYSPEALRSYLRPRALAATCVVVAAVLSCGAFNAVGSPLYDPDSGVGAIAWGVSSLGLFALGLYLIYSLLVMESEVPTEQAHRPDAPEVGVDSTG